MLLPYILVTLEILIAYRVDFIFPIMLLKQDP